MRDSTIFYRSFYEAIKELPAINQAEVYNAIFEYSLNFNEIPLTGLSKTIFTLIKPQIDANIKRYKSGIEPKVKRNISETEAKDKQNVSETEANVNDNDNVNVTDNVIVKVNNIEERKLKFADTLKVFNDKFERSLLLEFYKYWTEPNKSNTKFRMELEKTWELSRRLEAWAKNEKSFTKNKATEIPKIDTSKNEYIEKQPEEWK